MGDRERGPARIDFVAAIVTATSYHGISLSRCEMGDLVLSNSACRPRALSLAREDDRNGNWLEIDFMRCIVNEELFQQAAHAAQMAGVHAGL